MTDEEFLNDMIGSFKHKFAKKPEVIEGNMKALEMALKQVEKSKLKRRPNMSKTRRNTKIKDPIPRPNNWWKHIYCRKC